MTQELISALSRLAGNRHSDGTSSIVTSEDRSTIIQQCHDLLLAARHSNSNSGYTAEQIIAQIAQVSTGVGFQSGTPALEMAGQIVSVLAAHPEHIDRFMKEGTELLIDRTLSWEKGCLTYRARNGQILHPSDLAEAEGRANDA